MARSGNVDFRQLEELAERFNKMQQFDKDKLCEDCANELGQRLLRKVVKRTPHGEHLTVTYTKKDGTTVTFNEGKKGGTLKRGWDMKPATKQGNEYVCEVINPVEYASYVEYGHRQEPGRFVPQIGKRLKTAWAEGQFMLTKSEKEIQAIAPRLVKKRVDEKLEEMLNGK